MQVYQTLVSYTQSIASQLSCNQYLYYAGGIENDDEWNTACYKAEQQGEALGERMKHAFADVFENGHQKVVIIGTDCPQITASIIRDAFDCLTEKEVVIGPSFDGGYYLLGMKRLQADLFRNIAWSTASVFDDTIARCNELQLSYALLPALPDVDREEDLKYMPH